MNTLVSHRPKADRMNDKSGARGKFPIERVSRHNLPAETTGSVPPWAEKLRERSVKGRDSLGKPTANFSGDMGNTPARVVTVTVPSKRENPGSTPGLAFLKGGR